METFLLVCKNCQIHLGDVIAIRDSIPSLVNHEHIWLGLLDVSVVADDPRHADLPDLAQLIQTESCGWVMTMFIVEPVSLFQA